MSKKGFAWKSLALLGGAVAGIWLLTKKTHAEPLPGMANVYGIVTDNENQPISDVLVEIDGMSLQALTDNEGYYILSDVSPGDYTIVFSKVGYQTAML